MSTVHICGVDDSACILLTFGRTACLHDLCSLMVVLFCLAFCAIAALFWLLCLSRQSSPVMEEKVNPVAASSLR